MNRQPKPLAAPATVLGAIVLAATTGCQYERPVSVPALLAQHIVPPEHPDRGFLTEPYQATIRSSFDRNCREGILDLGNNEWEAALQQLTVAIDRNEKDEHAQFGAGLACEVLGRFDDALEHYKAANRCPPKLNPAYDASRRRVIAKIKYIQEHPGVLPAK